MQMEDACFMGSLRISDGDDVWAARDGEGDSPGLKG